MKKEKGIYIGEVIRRLRKAKGYSQEKVALDGKLNRTYLGELERNEKSPSLLTVIKLAKGLEMEPEQLVKKITETIDFDQLFEKE